MRLSIHNSIYNSAFGLLNGFILESIVMIYNFRKKNKKV